MPTFNFQPIRSLDPDILWLWIHILNGKQCRSWSVGFFRSQLTWIYTVCKGRGYPYSAELGLRFRHLWEKIISFLELDPFQKGTKQFWHDCLLENVPIPLNSNSNLHQTQKNVTKMFASLTNYHICTTTVCIILGNLHPFIPKMIEIFWSKIKYKRQFAWNVKVYLLEKIRKISSICCLLNLPRKW